MPTFPTSDFQIADPSDGTKLLTFDVSGYTSGTGFQRTVTAVDYPGIWVLADAESSGGQQVLCNFGGAGIANTWTDPDFMDSVFRISDQADSSKKLAFQASGISSSTIRTWTLPDHSMVPAGSASALTSGKYPIASTAGILIDGPTPLAGTKVYYVSDTSGGAVTRKLTFVDGILSSET